MVLKNIWTQFISLSIRTRTLFSIFIFVMLMAIIFTLKVEWYSMSWIGLAVIILSGYHIYRRRTASEWLKLEKYRNWEPLPCLSDTVEATEKRITRQQFESMYREKNENS